MFNLLYSYGYASANTILGLSIGILILILVLSLTIEIVFIVASVKIANKKGRSGAAWGFATFFFGIIPFIILLCLSPLDNNSYNSTPAPQKYSWKCHKCGQFNFGKDICTRCGTNKNAPLQPTSPLPPIKWTCPKCGEINNANAMHCINCYQKKPD